MLHPVDNRCHFSELKAMAQSPAHYKYACEHAKDMSRAITVGSVSDAIIFNTRDRIAVYPGSTRRGKEWDLFRQINARKVICLQSEYDDARGAAEAVLADPLSAGILAQCRFQVCLQWEQLDIQCASGIEGARGGIDAYDDALATIWDVKVTACSEPEALNKHAWRMWWYAQLAWLWDGGEMSGLIAPKSAGLICVEAHPPHVVTVMRVPNDVLDHGRKSIRIWLERLKGCQEANVWPGYCQGEVEMRIPDWMVEDDA